MELRELRSLLLLAETGSLQVTAERAHLTPAAVHKHLKTLQAELGAPLYAKRGGRLALSPAGEFLLPFARDLLAHHEAALAAVHEWHSAQRGLVRVGAGPSFSSALLPRLVKRYRRRFPGVDVFIETGSGAHLQERLRSGGLDLIFDLAGTALDDAALVQVAVWRADIRLISGRRDVPTRCRWHDLQTAPFILFQSGSRIEGIVARYLEEWNFRPRVIMRSDSAEAIKAMVRAGVGVSLLFTWNVQSDLRTGVLWAVKTEAPPLRVRMALIRMAGCYQPPPVVEFVKLTQQMAWPDLHPEPAARGSALTG